ncbi:MAG: RNA-binding protein S1 [Paenibacillaceae bacterium ZCTH02-B3]|nr:MAG: RNA-binding protein S1 [Paenibacillaceae bacterium ZCTH02-B3]
MTIEAGAKLEGRVTGIAHFGAFVELAEGVTGLVHISEIADVYVRDIREHLKINDIVTVKVLQVGKDGKISLSIRQASERPAEQRGFRERGGRPYGRANAAGLSFEDKMSRFLKDSEERISSLRKNTESKRGGRGGRRS